MPTTPKPPKSKMCTGRKAYKSREGAARAAEQIDGKDYRCAYCEGFHVSRAPIGKLK